VVADGRIFWIQDAYTVTDRYPYSTAFNGRFNYIRNSVKAVVDAYDGSVDFYVFEPDDPLVQAYQRIFPDCSSRPTEMPEYLRAHVRVPLDQFTVQTQMLLQYHMQDPVVFYNKEDQWSVPVQTSFGRSQALRPYYIVARLPGEERRSSSSSSRSRPPTATTWWAGWRPGAMARTTASSSSSGSPRAGTWTGPARSRPASTTTPSSPSSSRSGGRSGRRSCGGSCWSSPSAMRSSTPSPSS
jgi:hypothetical protein